ncbi:MAG: universal stress protein [Candidatus Altiarchaeota archaeon]
MQARHFLVPVDGSKSSGRTLDYAIEIAECIGAKITLMYVLDKTEDEDVLDAKSILRDLRDYASKKNVKVTLKLVRGEPWKEIVKEAKHGYYLVIIGSKGRSGISRMLLGSVAENVARKSPCPVTIVR